MQNLFGALIHARTMAVTRKHCEPVEVMGDAEAQFFPTFSKALEAFFLLTRAE